MNILICGLQGTGKTTLSKRIAKDLNFKYINDYTIFNLYSENSKSAIVDFICNNDNYVIDLCYSLTPNDCSKLNCITYFLGFSSIEPKILYKLMKEKGENITLSQIENNRVQSQQFQEECKKFNLPFYDINKDRNMILDCIINDVKLKLNGLKDD